MIWRIVSLIIGYLLGMFETGYIVGKFNNIDLREHGSGNTGTTNALRVMGTKAAAIVFVGDIIKTTAACLIAWAILRGNGEGYRTLVVLYTGLGAALGHDFPFYMNFKGGKGVAALGGMLLAYDWKLAILLIALFFAIVLITQYVSLASLTAASLFAVITIIKAAVGRLPVPYTGAAAETVIVAIVIVALIFIRHAANIQRLATGTENKTDLRGKKKNG